MRNHDLGAEVREAVASLFPRELVRLWDAVSQAQIHTAGAPDLRRREGHTQIGDTVSFEFGFMFVLEVLINSFIPIQFLRMAQTVRQAI